MLRACAGPDASKIDTGSLPEAVLFLISKGRERKKRKNQEMLVEKEIFFCKDFSIGEVRTSRCRPLDQFPKRYQV